MPVVPTAAQQAPMNLRRESSEGEGFMANQRWMAASIDVTVSCEGGADPIEFAGGGWKVGQHLRDARAGFR